MQHIIVIVFVAVAYVALAAISAAVAYSPADSWTVWLSSGLVLGVLLAVRRSLWVAVLFGGFVGATGFAFYLGSGVVEAIGYGAIEVHRVGWRGAHGFAADRVADASGQRARIGSPHRGGRSAAGVDGRAARDGLALAAGGGSSGATFRVWAIANFIGTLLVAPMIITWARSVRAAPAA